MVQNVLTSIATLLTVAILSNGGSTAVANESNGVVDNNGVSRLLLDSIKVVRPKAVPAPRWDYTVVYFVTNRAINENILSEKSSKLPNMYNEYFTSSSDIGVKLGWACVAYPTERQPAEQSYAAEGEFEAPAKDFTVKRIEFVDNRYDFESLIRSSNNDTPDIVCPKATARGNSPSTLFVHGWNNSFTTAVTRGSQLKLDLNRSSIVVLSWPSDKSGFASYFNAEQEEKQAKLMVPFVIGAIGKATNISPTIIAHSMGAKLYTDGILLASPELQRLEGQKNAPIVILAAPDIAEDDFRREGEVFRKRNSAVVVYCGPDVALQSSYFAHFFSPRLGSCSESVWMKDLANEMVHVSGRFRDTWRHSYFLSAPEMIEDMKAVLHRAEGQPGGLVSPGHIFRSLELR